MGMTVHVIHQTDVPLRTKMNLLGMQTAITAMAIDTRVPPVSAFAHPADINPVRNAEADALSQQVARDMVSTLKEPDGAEKMKAKWQGGSAGMPGSAPAPGQVGPEGAAPQGHGVPPEVQNALKGLLGI